MKSKTTYAYEAKKQYNAPITSSVTIASCVVCQVTSVQGNGPGFGGENNSIDPA